MRRYSVRIIYLDVIRCVDDLAVNFRGVALAVLVLLLTLSDWEVDERVRLVLRAGFFVWLNYSDE